MINIKVQDEQVLDYLNQLRARLANPAPAMDSIGQRLEEHIAMRFETRSDPNGKEWGQWEPSTTASYPFAGTAAAARDGGAGRGKVLERYGSMLGSLSHTFDNSSVTVGFGEPYAAYHEFGTRHMIRRGMLSADPNAATLGTEDRKAILEIIASYLDR